MHWGFIIQPLFRSGRVYSGRGLIAWRLNTGNTIFLVFFLNFQPNLSLPVDEIHEIDNDDDDKTVEEMKVNN